MHCWIMVTIIQMKDNALVSVKFFISKKYINYASTCLKDDKCNLI